MTSVVAMTEPFDAQMLDEPSDDMDMDAILDPWPHEMETDDHFSHEEPYNNDGVEMDLDAYQEDQEYEMSEADHDFSGEMLDVEETEPSENQVPVNIFSLTAPTADSAHLTTTSIETPFHSLLPTVRPDPIVADAGYDAVAEAHDLAQPTVDDAALTNVETLVEESTESVSAPDELHPELSTEEVSADVGDPSATFPVVDVADSQATGAHDISLSSEAVADDAQATWQEPDAPHPEMDEATATDVPKNVASPDPHEISAGVFIEPPPGIMLSFVGVDHPDACLFNQPSVASSSSAESPDLLVFLEDRPTLYYEPLNVVFDALRNDTNFSSLVDLSSSELVLDAYDLQLVISEDNIYAREATLHELNVIHDAAGGSGPLRLRLRTVVPRFIWRYRYLQAEINRLQLTGEDNETNQEQDQPGEENSNEQEAELEQVDNGPDQPNEEEVENDDPEPEDDSREEPEPAEAEEPQGHSNDVENPDLEDDITTKEDANQTFDAHDAQEEEYIDSLTAEASTEDDSNLDSSAPVADAVDENAPDADTSVVGEREKSHETSPNHEDVPADVADDLEDPHVIPDDIPPLPDDDDDDDDDDEDLEDLGNDEESSAQEVVQTDPAADYEEQEISENAENEDASEAYEDDPTEEPLVQEETKEYEETHAPAEEGDGEWDADDYSEEYDGEHHEEDAQEEDQNSWDQETISNQSSATLASRTSKRSIGEVEADEPDFEDSHSSPGSPGNKRPRIDHSSTSTVEDVE